MLIPHHKEYSSSVLSDLQVAEIIKQEIVVGSSVNDLFELTNEYSFTFRCSPKSIFNPSHIFPNHAFTQTHWGKLAMVHSMAKNSNEDAIITQAEITKWFEFLNSVALKKISIDYEADVASTETPIKDLFEGCKIQFHQLFDSNNAFEVHLRAIGMMLHIIQDSYTLSHCKRNMNGEIVQFYYYCDQNSEKHGNADDVDERLKSNMISECKKCAESIINGKKSYDFSNIMLLSHSTLASDGGEYA